MSLLKRIVVAAVAACAAGMPDVVVVDAAVAVVDGVTVPAVFCVPEAVVFVDVDVAAAVVVIVVVVVATKNAKKNHKAEGS